MKIKIVAAVLCMLSASLSVAQSPPASAASINELLTVTNARALIDGIVPQMEGMARSTIQQLTKGTPPSPEQQAKIDKSLAQMFKLYQEEFTWEKFQPMYVRIYQASFSQEEINGMLAFYRTPVGQATVKKMPLVMQNSMIEVQKMIAPILQKTQAMAREMQAAEQEQSKMPEAAPAKKTN